MHNMYSFDLVKWKFINLIRFIDASIPIPCDWKEVRDVYESELLSVGMAMKVIVVVLCYCVGWMTIEHINSFC